MDAARQSSEQEKILTQNGSEPKSKLELCRVDDAARQSSEQRKNTSSKRKPYPKGSDQYHNIGDSAKCRRTTLRHLLIWIQETVSQTN